MIWQIAIEASTLTTGPNRPSKKSMAPEAVIASMPTNMATIKGQHFDRRVEAVLRAAYKTVVERRPRPQPADDYHRDNRGHKVSPPAYSIFAAVLKMFGKNCCYFCEDD